MLWRTQGKGQVHFDEDLGYYYRDVKFIVDDPNGMFFKGQEVRQYSQYSRAFDFNGAQCHRRYYVFTKMCLMISKVVRLLHHLVHFSKVPR